MCPHPDPHCSGAVPCFRLKRGYFRCRRDQELVSRREQENVPTVSLMNTTPAKKVHSHAKNNISPLPPFILAFKKEFKTSRDAAFCTPCSSLPSHKTFFHIKYPEPERLWGFPRDSSLVASVYTLLSTSEDGRNTCSSTDLNSLPIIQEAILKSRFVWRGLKEIICNQNILQLGKLLILTDRWLRHSCQVRESLCLFFSHFPSFNSCDLSDLPVSFCKSSFQASSVGSTSCRCCGAQPAPGDGRTDGQRAGKLPGADGQLRREPRQRSTRAKGRCESGLALTPSSGAHRGARILPGGEPRRGCPCLVVGKRLCKA